MKTENRIHKSLLDNDLYKLTMMQFAYFKYPNSMVRYAFTCRNGVDLTGFVAEIIAEVKALCSLRFTEEELQWLAGLSFIRKDFISYLRNFQLKESTVRVEVVKGKLEIVVEGSWPETILLEVPLLSIVSELYFRRECGEPNYERGMEILERNIKTMQDCVDEGVAVNLADFGTRRRRSEAWHDRVVAVLKERLPGTFTGTSNMYYAMKYGLRPIGTMAHEYIMHFQGITHPAMAQQRALKEWNSFYKGELGVALTDTIGMDSFLKDFDKAMASAYSGVRWDSGDAEVWAEKMIAHYEQNGLDPQEKTFIFSDGLTYERAAELSRKYSGRVRTAMGIGTNTTNDFGESKKLSIVIKMTHCNGFPLCKISDEPAKATSPSLKYLNFVKELYGIAV